MFDERVYYKKTKVFIVGDALFYWNKGTMHEVPGGAPHGFGFTIDGEFHQVSAGQDIRPILELKYDVERILRDREAAKDTPNSHTFHYPEPAVTEIKDPE
jgi:hypothetical protein